MEFYGTRLAWVKMAFIWDWVAFLQGETDKCTGIYGSYFMNTICRGIINLHCPQQLMAALKEIYMCGTSTETTSKQITPLIENRKFDGFRNCGVSASDVMIWHQQQYQGRTALTIPAIEKNDKLRCIFYWNKHGNIWSTQQYCVHYSMGIWKCN